MNLFCEKFPEVISVDSADYPILTDFRVWAQVEQLLYKGLDSLEAVVSLYKLVFPQGSRVPQNIGDTVSKIIAFYACGETASKKGGKGSSGKRRVVSYLEDSGMIYAAFLAQYRIDLTESSVHWWKFRTLFDGLWETHQISKVIGYRSADVAKIKDKEQRKFYKDMQERFRLPDIRSREEIERDNIASLEKLF